MQTRRSKLFQSSGIRAVSFLLLLASPATATWSICLTDSETKEVAVGTVTCLTGFDLLAIVPVVVVGKGSAAVQAAGDFNGIRRPVIFDHLKIGTPPEEILEILARIGGHQSRQYGIADTQGRMITFTGSQNGSWAGGVIGTQGSMVYAIQGNVLAGACVISAIEQAVLNTKGDMAEKLMAGMEAARAMGGDGRCSCSQNNPPGCGCPPPDFDKAGHNGGVIVARLGDADDPVCNADGCADGDYFMRLNVRFQNSGRPDPVIQLREMFVDWRAGLTGRPDAMQSSALITPNRLPANGASTAEMLIQLRDWQDAPVNTFGTMVTVAHAPDSDGISTIGPVVDLGNGSFSVTLTAGVSSGTDQFWVVADDGVRPVVLAPLPVLQIDELGDGDGDGDRDLNDFAGLLGCVTGPLGAGERNCAFFDFDVDEDVDFADFGAFQLRYTGPGG